MIRLSNPANTQFAIGVHVLTLLASTPDGLQSSEEMADSVGSNPVHIRRVLGRLRNAGLVESRPGPKGGWRALRDPAKVRLGDVWRAMDGTGQVLGVHAANPNCPVGREIQVELLGLDRRAAAALVAELAEEDERGPSITVGRFEVEPNAPSVVPGRVTMVADVRGAGLDDPAELVEGVRKVAGKATVGEPFFQYGPVHFDPELVALLRDAAAGAGIAPMDMVSPAGHDAGWVARKVPTAMLFVPCRDGLSHHPDEWAEPEHLELATRVLADALARLAS